MANPAAVELDAGTLWVAPIGTTEPTGNPTAQAGPITGFRLVGYTDNGTAMDPYKPTITPVYVEEEYYPIRQATERLDANVDFTMLEMTRQNLALAINLGANAPNSTSSLEPGAPGSEIAVMLMWDSTVIGERWVFRSCIQTGALSIPRRKAPNKSMLQVSFALQKPVGVPPWIVWPATTGSLI